MCRLRPQRHIFTHAVKNKTGNRCANVSTGVLPGNGNSRHSPSPLHSSAFPTRSALRNRKRNSRCYFDSPATKGTALSSFPRLPQAEWKCWKFPAVVRVQWEITANGENKSAPDIRPVNKVQSFRVHGRSEIFMFRPRWSAASAPAPAPAPPSLGLAPPPPEARCLGRLQGVSSGPGARLGRPEFPQGQCRGKKALALSTPGLFRAHLLAGRRIS